MWFSSLSSCCLLVIWLRIIKAIKGWIQCPDSSVCRCTASSFTFSIHLLLKLNLSRTESSVFPGSFSFSHPSKIILCLCPPGALPLAFQLSVSASNRYCTFCHLRKQSPPGSQRGGKYQSTDIDPIPTGQSNGMCESMVLGGAISPSRGGCRPRRRQETALVILNYNPSNAKQERNRILNRLGDSISSLAVPLRLTLVCFSLLVQKKCA